jgi:ABC-type glutathione transport system ATPase component
VLRRFSFTVGKSESLGIPGESSCGKTTLAFAILHLLPTCSRATGAIFTRPGNLCTLPTARWRNWAVRRFRSFFKDPSSAQHPTLPARAQIAYVAAAHPMEWQVGSAVRLQKPS